MLLAITWCKVLSGKVSFYLLQVFNLEPILGPVFNWRAPRFILVYTYASCKHEAGI